MEIAQIGQKAENVYFGKPSGLMDQTASSVGGAVAIDFADPADPVVRSVAVDLNALGYALCIVDSGASHAALTGEYDSITQGDAGGGRLLRQETCCGRWTRPRFCASCPQLREAAGDRAVLRALHFFADDRRAVQEADALERGDFDAFLALVEASGLSSGAAPAEHRPTGAIRGSRPWPWL